jgi:hypothetical protein
VIAAFLLIGFMNLAKHRMHRYGWFLYAWRWFTGSHWDGHVQTNAGWRRKGTGKALTNTGFTSRFYYRPRWERAAIRTFFTFLIPAIVAGVVLDVQALFASLICVAVLGFVMAVLYAVRAARRHTVNRDWLTPTHQAIAQIADMPLSAKPSDWIEVNEDRSKVVLHLPAGYNATEERQERLIRTTAQKLGLEAPEVSSQLTGREPTLTLTASEPPPPKVFLANVRQAIANAGHDELVLGLGKKSKPVVVSLHEDSPHIGLSMRSGAGKSTLARFVAAQALHKGAIVLFLDIKKISHPWARGLPNVIYADTAEKIHEALLWVAGPKGELDRRNDVALYSSDYEGNISAHVGPRVLIVAEELNMTLGKLRSHWIDVLQGNGISPAILALQDVAFAGRQVRMNLFMVGQMLSARATGGGEARENIGIRMLARYTKRNWEMLVPEFSMPPVSAVLGRIQTVASGEVRETQAAYISGAEARSMASSGIIAALPHDVPESLVTVRASDIRELPNSRPEPLDEIDSTPVESMPMMISEAINAGILKGNINTIRTARQRDADFPKPVDRPPHGNSLAHYYSPVELADWQARKDMKGK